MRDKFKKYTFSSGTLEKLSFDYWTLELFTKTGERVIKTTVERLDAAQLINDYNNIKIISA